MYRILLFLRLREREFLIQTSAIIPAKFRNLSKYVNQLRGDWLNRRKRKARGKEKKQEGGKIERRCSE